MSYSTTFELLAKEIDSLMSEFSHTKKDIGYGYRWIFTNGQRVDLIDYAKQGKNILRVGRGARLVRKFPLLYDRFDEVTKVIAKVEIHDSTTLEEKNVSGVLKLLHEAPTGVRVFDY